MLPQAAETIRDATATGILAGVIVVLGNLLTTILTKRRESSADAAALKTLERIDGSINASTTAMALLTQQMQEVRTDIREHRDLLHEIREDVELLRRAG